MNKTTKIINTNRTPYAMIVMVACFGNRSLVTPLASQLPSFFAKTASCLNPIVFAISHPKYDLIRFDQPHIFFNSSPKSNLKNIISTASSS